MPSKEVLYQTGIRKGNSRQSTFLGPGGREVAGSIYEDLVQSKGNNIKDIRSAAEEKFKNLDLKSIVNQPEFDPEFDPLKFIGLLKRSVEGKINHLERVQAWEEMKTTNSPWTETLSLIKEKLYPNKNEAFFYNFATAWVLGIKRKVQKDLEDEKLDDPDLGLVKAAYEGKLNEIIKQILLEADEEKLKGLKLKGLVTEEILKSAKDYAKTFLLEEKRKVEQITSTDIERVEDGLPENSTAVVPPTLRTSLRERLATDFNNFRRKLRSAFPTINNKRRALAAALAAFTISLAAGLALREGKITPPEIFQAKKFPIETVSANPSHPLEPNIIYTNTPKAPNIETPESGSIAVNTPPPTDTQAPNKTATPEISQTISTPEPTIDLFNQKPLTINPQEPENSDLGFTIKPVPYNKDTDSKEAGAFAEQTLPGKGTAQVEIDPYGNILLVCHSGYKGEKPLECEGLRKHIEGGGVESNVPLLSPDEREKNLKALVGNKFTLESNGIVRDYVVGAVAYVPYEDTENFIKDYQESLNILIEITGGEKSPFYPYKTTKEGIFLIFCGWVPRDQSEKWWAATRYVIALEPIN